MEEGPTKRRQKERRRQRESGLTIHTNKKYLEEMEALVKEKKVSSGATIKKPREANSKIWEVNDDLEKARRVREALKKIYRQRRVRGTIRCKDRYGSGTRRRGRGAVVSCAKKKSWTR